MGFQPGHKLSTGRPKGSVRKKGVKQMRDSLAADGFDLAAELMKIVEDKTVDPAVRLNALKFIGQYTQSQYKEEPTEQDTTQESTDRPTADLVSIVKS